MKIIYIVKSKLHYYPPCMAQIQMLKDFGEEIEVWYGSCDQNSLDLLEKRGISVKKLTDRRTSLPALIDSAVNWFFFRVSAKKMLKSVRNEDVILWFGNVESIIPVKGLLSHFVYNLTVLELLDDRGSNIKRRLVMGIARNARIIVACQQTRAYIMRSWWRLKSLPYVMPNKPYKLTLERNCKASNAVTEKYISKIEGKRVILFQGILQHSDLLSEFAKALKNRGNNEVLVLMGSDERDKNLVHKIQGIYPDTIHIPYIPAPLHLEITSHASIGLVFYRDDSLNRAYCAPNKIYEYSYFGIPMIGNKIPGLVDTIGVVGAAECIELVSNKIEKAIDDIMINYESYSKASHIFFSKTDNYATMQEIITQIEEYMYE